MASEDVLSVRPQVSLALAVEIATSIFGLSDVNIFKELESYEDRNFHLSGTHLKCEEKEEFVLKVMHSFMQSKESANAKCEYIRQLAEHSTNVKLQGLVISVNGEINVPIHVPLSEDVVESSRHKIQSGAAKNVKFDKDGNPMCLHLVRLMTYINGDLLSSRKLDKAMLYDLGRLAGSMQQWNENVDISWREPCRPLWDLGSITELREDYLPDMKEPSKYKLAAAVIDEFEQRVLPILDSLPAQFIHGDLNEANILVTGYDDSKRCYTFGVIDFGESMHSCRVFDLAIHIAYMMLEVDIQGGVLSHVEVASAIMDGYFSITNDLTASELNVLHILIACRICQSLLIGSYQASVIDPDNVYLSKTNRNGWSVLKSLLESCGSPFLEAWLSLRKLRF